MKICKNIFTNIVAFQIKALYLYITLTSYKMEPTKRFFDTGAEWLAAYEADGYPPSGDEFFHAAHGWAEVPTFLRTKEEVDTWMGPEASARRDRRIAAQQPNDSPISL